MSELVLRFSCASFGGGRRRWPGSIMSLMAGALLFAVVSNSHANKESTLIDCGSAPETAVLEIDNADIAQWAQIKCTRFGHLVVPQEGYFWTFHGGYLPIVLAAQKFPVSMEPEVVNHNMHFTRIDALELDDAAAKDIEQRARFESAKSLIEASQVFELTAISINELSQTIYFLVSDEKIMGAMPYPEGVDKPADDALLPFIVIDIEKQRQKKERESQGDTSG